MSSTNGLQEIVFDQSMFNNQFVISLTLITNREKSVFHYEKINQSCVTYIKTIGDNFTCSVYSSRVIILIIFGHADVWFVSHLLSNRSCRKDENNDWIFIKKISVYGNLKHPGCAEDKAYLIRLFTPSYPCGSRSNKMWHISFYWVFPDMSVRHLFTKGSLLFGLFMALIQTFY